jgi:hypothetical protein
MMTREEILKLRPDFAELIARMPPMPPKPKPKPEPEIRAPLNGKIAEAAKANPASVEVRVSAVAEDGTTVIDRPRRTEVLEVLEVDGQGRPALARRYETATGGWSTVEFDQGYRRNPGAQHEYNPLDALKRD